MQQLKSIASVEGKADLSSVLPLYEEWYRKAKNRFETQPNVALASAYFNRHRVHILKLAVVYEVSLSGSLKVSEQSWYRAVETARGLEETIFQLLATGMTGAGYALTQMEDRIRAAGADGLALSEFTRTFQHQDRRERLQRLETLKEADKVLSFTRPSSGGRRGVVLVHQDHAEGYKLENGGGCRLLAA